MHAVSCEATADGAREMRWESPALSEVFEVPDSPTDPRQALSDSEIAAPPPPRSPPVVVVVSDGEDGDERERSPQHLAHVPSAVQPSPWSPPPVVTHAPTQRDGVTRRPSAADLRRQRMEAARAALQRAKNAPPRRVARADALLSTYRCPICLSAPTNASITPCGHVFCGTCLHDSLTTQMRRDGHEWTAADWLGAMQGSADTPRHAASLFTPFGSSGAMALANAAGVSTSPTRELFTELVSQRRANHAEDTAPRTQAPPPAGRLRSSNGTARIRGLCPVCRGAINGGFTGAARRGILGLELMLGTPAPARVPAELVADAPRTLSSPRSPALRGTPHVGRVQPEKSGGAGPS
ncbi:hypothetical protein MSPP1_000720 [Malassezia sp. CBS 17886]|nr:hypothetical protein MSPP1_000720 [Malassezia sp. CBS 17886]